MKIIVDVAQSHVYMYRMNKNLTTSLISLRSTPCRCGCHGKDSWHKKNIRRVVVQTSDTTGTFQAPWGISNVTREEFIGPTTGRKMFGMWVKSEG